MPAPQAVFEGDQVLNLVSLNGGLVTIDVVLANGLVKRVICHNGHTRPFLLWLDQPGRGRDWTRTFPPGDFDVPVNRELVFGDEEGPAFRFSELGA